ncbi:unnamed protein product [Oreochromis niloticus]|nr:unnamed protein product [Mustela putorius furo]
MRQSPTSAADSPTPTAAVPPLTPQTLHTSSIHPAHSSPPPTTASNTHSTQGSSLSLSTTQVRRELRRIKAKKAAGPDGISSRVVRSCADQLCGVMEHLFNLSLRLGRVPQLWKTSCVVPVPKTSRPKDLNSYRPVALTSHLMKTLERLVLAQLRRLVSSSLDPLQFAYQPGIGADDAIIHLLHRSLAHLETAGSTVRIMFFDFSSAFNTILPSVLKDKLENSGVDHHLTTWILDYLTDRPQYVRTQGCVSDRVVCSTGAPQGTVLAPFLFTIYTADFSHNSTQCFLQKFSDDSAIVGLITDGDDKEYRGLTQDFVDWCQLNYLQINASKTKELVVDFRRHKHPPLQPLNIQGMDIEAVDSYRYLGVHLNNKLDWTHNSDALYRKGQSRLYLLRRLRSFGVEGPLLKTFYDSVVASAIFYGVVCWGGSISAGDRKRLNRLIRRASSVLGCPLDPVEVVSDRRMVAKLSSLLDNISHPMHETVTALSSSFSGRLRHPRCGTERFRRPVEDREKRIRDRIFNGPSETPEEHRPIPFAPCSPASSRPHRIRPIGARFRSYRETDTEVAGGVRLVTAFRETPRDSLHPLGGFFGEVQPQRELSSASSSSSDGSSVTSQYSYTPEEFRAIPFVKTPSSPPPFTPCPPSPSRPHRSQIPVRTKNYRETDKEVAGGVRLVTAQHMVWTLDQAIKKIVDAYLPQTSPLPAGAPARVVALTPAGAPAPLPARGAGAPARVVALTPSAAPAPLPARGAGAPARVVALTPAGAPAPLPARGAGAPARVVALTPAGAPAPLPARGAGAPARVVALTPAPAPAPPAQPPGSRKPRRGVKHPPEVDFKGLITGYLVSIDEKLGEELQPVWNPSDTLELSLSLLSQDDWQKKIQGLRYIRTLARHHQDKLTSLNLRKVCLGVTQEIKNNRSCVSCAALDTVGYLCVHLKERMDTEADLTCESLLRVFAGANANPFIQQHAKEALTALVHHCSPSRFITSLERHGLKHKSVLVRAGAALGLLMISEVMGAEKVLSAGQSFTTRFLSAVSVVCLDASSEVRSV